MIAWRVGFCLCVYFVSWWSHLPWLLIRISFSLFPSLHHKSHPLTLHGNPSFLSQPLQKGKTTTKTHQPYSLSFCLFAPLSTRMTLEPWAKSQCVCVVFFNYYTERRCVSGEKKSHSTQTKRRWDQDWLEGQRISRLEDILSLCITKSELFTEVQLTTAASLSPIGLCIHDLWKYEGIEDHECVYSYSLHPQYFTRPKVLVSSSSQRGVIFIGLSFYVTPLLAFYVICHCSWTTVDRIDEMQAAFVRKSREKTKIEVKNDLIVMAEGRTRKRDYESGSNTFGEGTCKSKKPLTVSENGRQSIKSP